MLFSIHLASTQSSRVAVLAGQWPSITFVTRVALRRSHSAVRRPPEQKRGRSGGRGGLQSRSGAPFQGGLGHRRIIGPCCGGVTFISTRKTRVPASVGKTARPRGGAI